MNRETLLDLIPAYALGALDAEEIDAVEALLASDAEAQQLYREYEDITTVLAFAVPQRSAPANLSANFKQRLAAQQSAQAKIRQMPERPATPQAQQAGSAPVVAKPKANITRFPNILLAAAAAILVVAVGVFVILNQNPTSEPSAGELIYNDITAGDFDSFALVPDTAETVNGELVVSADGTQAILRVASLPDTTDAQRYQVWVRTDDGLRSGGVFNWPTGHGPYFIAIDEPAENLVEVGMSIEPEGGSPLIDAPSGPRLFGVPIRSS